MNTMQYSKICENINFFLILSLDIGLDLFFGSFICILTYNGGQNVQTFQSIDPLVMTSVDNLLMKIPYWSKTGFFSQLKK